MRLKPSRSQAPYRFDPGHGYQTFRKFLCLIGIHKWMRKEPSKGILSSLKCQFCPRENEPLPPWPDPPQSRYYCGKGKINNRAFEVERHF